jgi:GTP-binding protein
VAFNKIDLPDAKELYPLVRDELTGQGYEVFAISGVTGEGTQELLWRIAHLLEDLPPDLPEDREIPVIRLEDDERVFWIERGPSGWRVRGERVERLAAMTPFELDEAVHRFQRALEAMGIPDALREAGVQPGDTVYIGEKALEWEEEEDPWDT